MVVEKAGILLQGDVLLQCMVELTKETLNAFNKTTCFIYTSPFFEKKEKISQLKTSFF